MAQQPVQWQKPFVPYDQIASIGAGDTFSLTYNATNVWVDCRQGGAFNLTFGAGNITNFNFLQPWPGQRVRLLIQQDASGSRTVTNWLDQNGNAVRWAAGTPVTLSTGANAIDVLAFQWEATTNRWYAETVGKAFA
jgi:hypothetical protein